MKKEIFLDIVLQREMLSRNLSLNDLANACEIPKTTLHGWIQGIQPSAKNLHHLKVLSDFLEIPLSILLFNARDDHKNFEILFSSSFINEGKEYRFVIEQKKK